MELNEYIVIERKFLHEVSNHLVVAEGMLSLLESTVHKNEGMSEKEKDRFNKSLGALKKIKDCLIERKQFVVQEHEKLT